MKLPEQKLLSYFNKNRIEFSRRSFPLLVLLDRLKIFPAQVPSNALVTESMGTEVAEVYLSSL